MKRWQRALAMSAGVVLVVGSVSAGLALWWPLVAEAQGMGIGPGYGNGGYSCNPGSAYGPYGMMGGGASSLRGVQPLTEAEARATVTDYLAGLNNKDLRIDEIMIFDNQAYAEIQEVSTGMGAFEVLVDPVTHAVYQEPGPNMMWNEKYGYMNGHMGYGMMGGYGFGNAYGPNAGYSGMMPWPAPTTAAPSSDMPVSADEAIAAAQQYLNSYLPGASAATEADAFYGYYTIDILRDGQIVGMLGVNGYSSQVMVHTWHGNFISVTEEPQA